MADLLGPANAPNAVTQRPDDTRIFGGSDTWFKDCTSPTAGDGTRVTAAFLDGVLGQLRRAIRGMSVTEDNADDDMLLKAILAAATLSVSVAAARAHLPIFPHVVASNGLFAFTGSTGQVVVDAGQTFIHRGAFEISTDAYAAPARTFVVGPNKTYHLRWQWNAGSPAFALKDLADSGYNPTAAAETAIGFDTTYDDMLVAKIVTNGSNAPTITALENRAQLTKHLNLTVVPTSVNPDAWKGSFAATLNWSRMPSVAAVNSWLYTATTGNAVLSGGANKIESESFSRYVFAHEVLTDWTQDPLGLFVTPQCGLRGSLLA